MQTFLIHYHIKFILTLHSIHMYTYLLTHYWWFGCLLLSTGSFSIKICRSFIFKKQISTRKLVYMAWYAWLCSFPFPGDTSLNVASKFRIEKTKHFCDQNKDPAVTVLVCFLGNMVNSAELFIYYTNEIKQVLAPFSHSINPIHCNIILL